MRVFSEVEPNQRYIGSNGEVLQREGSREDNLSPYRGHWVLRDAGGEYIDHDQYRGKLSERHGLTLVDLPWEPSR